MWASFFLVRENRGRTSTPFTCNPPSTSRVTLKSCSAAALTFFSGSHVDGHASPSSSSPSHSTRNSREPSASTRKRTSRLTASHSAFRLQSKSYPICAQTGARSIPFVRHPFYTPDSPSRPHKQADSPGGPHLTSARRPELARGGRTGYGCTGRGGIMAAHVPGIVDLGLGGSRALSERRCGDS